MQTYNVSRLPSIINIGYDGENNWRPQAFDCSVLLANHPNGVITLWLLPNGESEAFLVALERDGNTAVWTPTSAELVVKTGQLQLMCVDGIAVGKSAVVYYKRADSLVSGEASDTPSWAVQVVEDVTEAASHYPQIIDGYWWVWDVDDGIWVNTEVKASGGEISPSDIADAVADYLEENPVTVTETDPTVPAWAKAAQKPSYTAQEVGAQDAALIGQADDDTASDYLTPTQVYNALSAGKDVLVTKTDEDYGALTFSAWNTADTMNVVVANSIVLYNGVHVMYPLYGNTFNNRWYVLPTILATSLDIPNPANTEPSMDGTASPGSSAAYARGDHVHPAELPSGGSTGDFLVKTANGVAWTTLSAWQGGSY